MAVVIPTFKVKQIWTRGKESAFSTALIKAPVDLQLANADIDYHICYNGVNHYVPICK